MDPTLGDTIQVWYCRTDDPHALARREEFLTVLSPDERSRYEAFRLERSKWEFLLAHGLLRFILSRYGSTPPQDWMFDIEGNGKPRLAATHSEGLRFNISHTRGYVALALSHKWNVGIDVQHVRERSVENLIQSVLAPWEQEYLAAHGDDCHQQFFRFWTLKEAYLKATGDGLSSRLQEFGFDLEREPPQLKFKTGSAPDAFEFREFQPDASVKMSVASFGAAGQPSFRFEHVQL